MTVTEPEDLPKIESRGAEFVRRSWRLWAAVGVIFAVSPCFWRYVEDYRAIVLEKKDGKMLLAFPNHRPYAWVEATDAEPGQMLVKQAGAWDTRQEAPQPDDDDLVRLHERYTLTYAGTVVDIIDPPIPSRPRTLVIAPDGGGGNIYVAVYAEHLSLAEVGRRVEKLGNTWDPVLTTKPPPAGSAIPTGPGLVTLQPPPLAPAAPAPAPPATPP